MSGAGGEGGGGGGGGRRRGGLFDDLAGVAGGAFSVMAGLRQEVEAMVRAQADAMVQRLDLVRREELDAALEVARRAREAGEALEARIAALEARLAAVGALEARLAAVGALEARLAAVGALEARVAALEARSAGERGAPATESPAAGGTESAA